MNIRRHRGVPIMAALLLSSILISSLWVGSFACNGYTLHVRKLATCDPGSIIKLHNFNVSLTEDCMVVPTGCIENTKEVHTSKVSYTVVRNMAPISGTKDGCKAFGGANEEVTGLLNMFALPTSCPIKAGKVCDDNKKVDVNKYKHKLALLLGDIQATINVETDAGNACVEFKGSVTKRLVPRIPMIG